MAEDNDELLQITEESDAQYVPKEEEIKKDDELQSLQKIVDEQAAMIYNLEELAEKRLECIRDVVRVALEEQFIAYKISS